VNHGEASCFLARIGDCLVRLINIVRLEMSDVALRSAEMPAQVVKTASFRTLFTFDDEFMFLNGDGALGLEANFWPQTLGNERQGSQFIERQKL
jgi:hypothetical protein